jgi:hypothetical protein
VASRPNLRQDRRRHGGCRRREPHDTHSYFDAACLRRVAAHLKLQVRTTPTGSFATIKTVLTSSKGTAHVTVRPAHTVWYRWSYAGNAGHGRVNSGTEKVTVGGKA